MHGALERLLLEEVGVELGGRLRAGRSRNDQVATLFKAFLRDHARVVAGLVLDLVDAIAGQAEQHLGAVMPGRTHLQHAQPVLLSHHLLAHAWPLLRDVGRLRDWDARVAVDSPYGSGALAGSSLGLDPQEVARDLGFTGSSPNSIDGTAARDFVAEFAFVAAMVGVDVSRQAEEVILWATKEFGFVHARRRLLHRVEHHAAEEEPRHRRARPRQGRPADRQPRRGCWPPSRRCRWPTTATCRRTRSRSSTRSTPSRCCCRRSPAWSRRCASTPTGWPSWPRRASRWPPTSRSGWSAQGVPFRVAHEVAGACVRRCEELGIDLDGLTDEQFAEIYAHLTPGVRDVLTVEGSVASRDARGGTAPVRVTEQLAELRAAVADHRAWLG